MKRDRVKIQLNCLYYFMVAHGLRILERKSQFIEFNLSGSKVPDWVGDFKTEINSDVLSKF